MLGKVLALCAVGTAFFLSSPPFRPLPQMPTTTQLYSSIKSASDPNFDMQSPEAKKEVERLQRWSDGAIRDELWTLGFEQSKSMSDFECLLLLAEVRIRTRHNRKKSVRTKPAANSSKSSIIRYEMPWIDRYCRDLLDQGDYNKYNCFVEYLNDKEEAEARYSNSPEYVMLFRRADSMMAMEPPKQKRVLFSGFPSGMGEATIRRSLEEFGPVDDFTINLDPAAPTCDGMVLYEDPDAAQAAVDKWDGVDMGDGSALSLAFADF